MIFIETKLFTKLLPNYLEDKEYSGLQTYLLRKPDAGDIIKGTGGLRKIRWAGNNKGKSGGVRIIYYWYVSNEQIYFMTIYAKNEMADLSARERRILKQLIDEILSDNDHA